MNSCVITDMNADWMQSYNRILCNRIFFKEMIFYLVTMLSVMKRNTVFFLFSFQIFTLLKEQPGNHDHWNVNPWEKLLPLSRQHLNSVHMLCLPQYYEILTMNCLLRGRISINPTFQQFYLTSFLSWNFSCEDSFIHVYRKPFLQIVLDNSLFLYQFLFIDIQKHKSLISYVVGRQEKYLL